MRRLPTNSLITNLLHRQPYVDTILFSGGKILIKKLPLLHEWKKRRKEKSRKMGSEHPEKNQTELDDGQKGTMKRDETGMLLQR